MTEPQPQTEIETCNDPVVWLDHLFGHLAGWVTLFSSRNGRPAVDWAETTNLDKLGAVAQRRAEESCVWFGAATRKERLDGTRRGGAEDCLELTGLWADIDYDSPNHRGGHVLPPTIEAANELVGDFPLPPTAMVRSGGGLQPWWLFTEPIPVDETTIRLLASWGATWVELGGRRGWHVDNVFEPARIMRLPGTWNRKVGEPVPVTAKAVWARRYNLDDFEPHLFDPPPAPEAVMRIPYIGPERPGDAFNAVRRGGDVLAAAGFTPGRRVASTGEEHWVRPGKDRRAGTSATVYPDGHTTIWSETVVAWWPAVELQRPYDPFGLYTVLFHGGDFVASSDVLAAQGYGTKACAEDDLAWIDGAHPAVEVDDEEPQPVSAVAWPQMPADAYEGILGETVEHLAPQTEADPAGILACLLTYFGAAVGPGPHIRISGTTHPARLFTLIAGESARARKGTAETMARWPMRTADAAITSERRCTGLNSGEGLIEAVRDPKWGKNKDGDDVLLDEGVSDKRLLLYEPEFAGRLLTAVRRSGSTISAILRSAWDDGDLQTMSRNPLRATGAHLCIIGTVTVDELLHQMTAQDLAGGLLNRFLFVAVRSTRRLPFGGDIDDLAVERIGRRLRERLELARTRTRVEFSPAARDHWPAVYDALSDDVPDGALGHLTARGPIQVQRLALIYALADGADRIDIPQLEAALAFWAYCRDSAEMIVGSDVIGGFTGDVDGDRLLGLLVESGRPWSVTELKAELRWSGTKICAVRARLELLGLVRVGQQKTTGRPRTVVEAK